MKQKIRIRLLSPVCSPLDKNKCLKPGVYAAELNRNGILTICKPDGFLNGIKCFIPKPDQFEFIDAPIELINVWNAKVALIKAQGEYEASWREYQNFLNNFIGG